MSSVGFGFILGLIYDIFRLIRVLIIKNSKAVIAQDVIYFLLCAVLTFVFLLVINNGRFRFNILLALVIGFVVYYVTLGRFVGAATVFFVKRIKKALYFFAGIITAPYRLVMVLYAKITRKLPKNYKNIKFSRKKAEKPLENKE